MKDRAVKLANRLLAPLGAKLVSTKPGPFTMWRALRRLRRHGFGIETMIDIGASDGRWSLQAMSVLPTANCLAVEPLSEREAELAAVKRRRPRFDYELCAAGAPAEESVTLFIPRDPDGSAVDAGSGTPRIVRSRTVDAMVAERSFSGPFLIKFDSHGYEVPILRGATETLAVTRVIVMEVYNFQTTRHVRRFHQMCAYLEELGFRCYDFADPLLRVHDDVFWQADLFFCRRTDKIFSYPDYV